MGVCVCSYFLPNKSTKSTLPFYSPANSCIPFILQGRANKRTRFPTFEGEARSCLVTLLGERMERNKALVEKENDLNQDNGVVLTETERVAVCW